MKIVLISDTHGRHDHLTSKGMGNILPEGDLLIHAGDFSNLGQKGEVEDFFDWCKTIAPRYKHGIVVIAGNHDKCFDPKYGEYHIDDEAGSLPKVIPAWVRNLKNTLYKYNIHYLENNAVILDDVMIWGSPISPWFSGDRWAFNKYRGDEIGKVWSEIPLNSDIIVTHTPSSYKVDYIPDANEYAGCEELRFRIKEIKPMLHVCGHIHEGYGVDYDQDTIYVNAATCNLRYEPVNKPIVIEFNKTNREVTIL